MLSINSKCKAVVLANGTIQCLTESNSSVKKAVTAAEKYGGHEGVTVKDVALVEVGAKSVLEWVVVEDVFETLAATRAEARLLVKLDKRNGFSSHIERREYLLVSSKKVS